MPESIAEMAKWICQNVNRLNSEQRAEYEESYNIGSPLANLIHCEILDDDDPTVVREEPYLRAAYRELKVLLNCDTEYVVTLADRDGRVLRYTVEAESPVEAFRKLSLRTSFTDKF